MDRREQIAVLAECKKLSLAGEIPFAEVVRRLQEAGVERYHVDVCRDETTYYLPSGESHLLPNEGPRGPIAEEFDSGGVAAAVRGAQRGEVAYPDFLRRIMAAGCVGYFAQIAGRRVLYFGRTGDTHIEHFPPATQ